MRVADEVTVPWLPPGPVPFGCDNLHEPQDEIAARALFAAMTSWPATLHDEITDALFADYVMFRHMVGDALLPDITAPAQVWDHVDTGDLEIDTTRSRDDPGVVFVSWSCDCAWESEHGFTVLLHEARIVAMGARVYHPRDLVESFAHEMPASPRKTLESIRLGMTRQELGDLMGVAPEIWRAERSQAFTRAGLVMVFDDSSPEAGLRLLTVLESAADGYGSWTFGTDAGEAAPDGDGYRLTFSRRRLVAVSCTTS
jgi:hypothetical protein